VKPSEKVPLTLTRVAEIWSEAGLPAGVFNIVHGTAETVNSLIDHPLTKCITFVGTSKVADLIYRHGLLIRDVWH
jgi:malonate-semialdehyde dehydrogenase (acetylating) / methylmalonate-semialdehyde dehydrogenase